MREGSGLEHLEFVHKVLQPWEVLIDIGHNSSYMYDYLLKTLSEFRGIDEKVMVPLCREVGAELLPMLKAKLLALAGAGALLLNGQHEMDTAPTAAPLVLVAPIKGAARICEKVR